MIDSEETYEEDYDDSYLSIIVDTPYWVLFLIAISMFICHCSISNTNLKNCRTEIYTYNRTVFTLCDCYGDQWSSVRESWSTPINIVGARCWVKERRDTNYIEVISFDKGFHKGRCCYYSFKITGRKVNSGSQITINKDDFILDRKFGPQKKSYDKCEKDGSKIFLFYPFLLFICLLIKEDSNLH